MKSYCYCFTVTELHLSQVTVLTLYNVVSRRRAAKIRKSLDKNLDSEDAYYYEFSNPIDFNNSWKRELRLSEYPCEIIHAF